MPDDRIRTNRRDEDDPEDRPRRRRRRYEDEEEDDDDYDDRPSIRRRDDGLNSLIPYKNPKALTGYYLSVFSLIPCAGLFLGPAAFILGILGMRYRNQNPTAGGMAHAIVALVLGFITSAGNWGAVLFVLVGILTKK
ncbi:MAG: hypothetical protein U0840_05150 [Gemmataceae bacterium]